MSREWNPGDVALVNGRVCMKVDGGWEHGDPRAFRYADSQALDVRPLVVIDPEDAERVERLAHCYIDANPDVVFIQPETAIRNVRNALREFANPTPPKPEPPKFPALVVDGDGEYWALHANGSWTCVHSNPGIDPSRTWDTLCADYGPIRTVFSGPNANEASP